jgi:hypothetical protein
MQIGPVLEFFDVRTYPGQQFFLSVTWPDGSTDEAILTEREALSFPLTRRAFLKQTGRLLHRAEFEQPGRAGRQAWLSWVAEQLNGRAETPVRPAIPVEVMAARSLN